MNKRRSHFFSVGAVLFAIVLAASGCATKKYVSKQISPVNQRLGQFEKQTNDRIAWLNNKEQNDISQLNERLATTDQKVSEVAGKVADVAGAAQEAQGTASRAMEASAETATANSEAIKKVESNVNNALTFDLAEETNVMFGFDKANLTPSAKAKLDEIVTKVQALPRAVVEVAGFTDQPGSRNYNLGLSRRRAWAVQRYLVEHKVPPRSIHVVGLGEDAPPEYPASGMHKGRDAMARRVNIRVFGAGEIASADRSTQEPQEQ
jgi:outer membrane protein OmpA-like peptidoglycan-associated protein